jgi:hypothetical protein
MTMGIDQKWLKYVTIAVLSVLLLGVIFERPTHPGLKSSPSQPGPTAANAWYGIRQVPMGDLESVADSLGGKIISLGVGTLPADEINTRLDLAQSLGYRVVIAMYTEETCSQRPWDWNGTQWVFPQSTVETLQGIAHHPALFAINALHEPFDITNECHWTVEQHQELSQLLRDYTDGVPVWSDVGGLAYWERRGVELVDGICDYCATFHHSFRSDWTSEQCLQETLNWIDADLDTQQRLMPHSQVVFQIQVFSYAGYAYPIRLPSAEELAIVRDHLCALNQPMVYYPWSHGTYDSTLKDALQLWPVVAEGCIYIISLPMILAHSGFRTALPGDIAASATFSFTLSVSPATGDYLGDEVL